jgi:hypothetical protein
MTAEQEAEMAQLSAQFTDADYDALEADLRLRAACLGWTGDPLQQPVDVVLAVARGIAAKKTTS